MTTVRDMIRKKGSAVYAVTPDATVFEVLKSMAKHNTGAMLVMTGTDLEGIVSERDCVRKVELMGKNAMDTKVSEIMTSDVITVDCSQPLADCMALMNEKGIRHLPVFDDRKLMGLISVRDVLKEMIEMQQVMLSQLERYITGSGR
jgi:CBS domain-containing protein